MLRKLIQFRPLGSNRYFNWLKIVVQVALLWGISAATNAVANIVHSPIPGSIIGFVALFLLLKFKVIKLSWVEKGGDFLLSNLLLFFIPAAVGIVQYGHMVRVDGVRLVGLILISIVMVMGWTGFLAERLAKRQHRIQTISSDGDVAGASAQQAACPQKSLSPQLGDSRRPVESSRQSASHRESACQMVGREAE